MDRGYFVASDGEIQLKFIKHDENSEKHDYAYIYTPDFVAKKNEDIYVFEVKVNTGIQYFKGEKKEGLLLSKEYGFIPVLVTLNVDIKASNFKINEL